jgi:hypothetical protein
MMARLKDAGGRWITMEEEKAARFYLNALRKRSHTIARTIEPAMVCSNFGRIIYRDIALLKGKEFGSLQHLSDWLSFAPIIQPLNF